MEVDTMDAILAQNKAMAQQLITLNKKMEKLEEDQPMEQVNYMGNQPRQPFHDPNASTYNPGWRNHPNLGWGGNQNPKNGNFQNCPPYQQFQRPPFQPPFQLPQPGLPNLQPKPPQPNSFEAALEKLTLKMMDAPQPLSRPVRNSLIFKIELVSL
ncbi:hypothetical protein PIB30_093613 [Stylosanthes scabra]|uniref:Uncharacterized protein n=1 Tax=Stylosanthes scabra TaxID=79078 RepID=A0ABU6QUM7_9FABA|nr:hypothetical protein [Stylosanthes scabra]